MIKYYINITACWLQHNTFCLYLLLKQEEEDTHLCLWPLPFKEGGIHFLQEPWASLATSAPARSACSHFELLDQAKLSYSPADALTACELHPDPQALSFPIRIHTGRTKSSDIYFFTIPAFMTCQLQS